MVPGRWGAYDLGGTMLRRLRIENLVLIKEAELTFVAPHAIHIRPLVVPRGPDVVVTNLTAGLETTVLVDGQQVGMLANGDQAIVRVGVQPSLLATLPEATFFSRYAATFGR